MRLRGRHEPRAARGEVWWSELPEIARRPVVALSRNAAIPRPSAVHRDSVEIVAIAVLVERIGRLADMRMGEVCAALEVAVDCRG